ncbi:MAG: ABC transporter permease [Oscillibacter sp.]|jgi:ABC-2 type transport system permease protein|nr:ABC transporter permease [Oscillibacter sp.]
MKAIYKRELSSYFNSMIGWVFIAVSTVFIGIYFMVYNLFSGKPYFSDALSATLFVFMLTIPLLTMRSMAEERRTRTDQLLLSAPVSIPAVILGKYFALLTVFLIPTALSCLCPLIIKLNGTAFLRADYATIFAFFLLGALEIAIGLLISSLTESQILAAVGTFCALLLLFLWDGLVHYLPTSRRGSLIGLLLLLALLCYLLAALSSNRKLAWGAGAAGAAAAAAFYLKVPAKFENLLPNVLGKFSPLGAFDAFASDHVFDLRGLLLYLSLTVLMLFLTDQVVQKRRWN